jgi:hypothetical protein
MIVGNNAAPVCGQAMIDKLTKNSRSSYGYKNQGMSRKITNLKKEHV